MYVCMYVCTAVQQNYSNQKRLTLESFSSPSRVALTQHTFLPRNPLIPNKQTKQLPKIDTNLLLRIIQTVHYSYRSMNQVYYTDLLLAGADERLGLDVRQEAIFQSEKVLLPSRGEPLLLEQIALVYM